MWVDELHKDCCSCWVEKKLDIDSYGSTFCTLHAWNLQLPGRWRIPMSQHDWRWPKWHKRTCFHSYANQRDHQWLSMYLTRSLWHDPVQGSQCTRSMVSLFISHLFAFGCYPLAMQHHCSSLTRCKYGTIHESSSLCHRVVGFRRFWFHLWRRVYTRGQWYVGDEFVDRWS